MSRRYSVLLLALGLASAGCDERITAPTSTDLSGRWRVVEILATDGVAAVPSDVRLEVEFVDGTLAIRADCNVCRASYSTSGRSLTVGLVACTLAACPNMTLANRFVAMLGRAAEISVFPGYLEIGGSGGTLRLAR